MKVAMAQEMREIDRPAMEEYGYPGLLLMEHAALALFQAIKARFPLEKVGIVCGKGNNAGDGWALARLLTLAGAEVLVFAPEEEGSCPRTRRPTGRSRGV